MFLLRGVLCVLFAATVVLAPGVSAQQDTGPSTDLTLTGAVNDEVTGSDGNACFTDGAAFHAQLAGATTTSILSIDLSSTTPGTYQLSPSGGPKLTMLSLSDDPNEVFVNWYPKAGTLTITSLDSQVPVGDGSASTKGATGAIDADLSADKHGTFHVSGAWACHMPF